MRKLLLIFLVSVLMLLLLSASILSSSPIIDWYAVGSSSDVLTSGSVELHSIVGQGIASEVAQVETELCSGYLCILIEFATGFYALFLPLIRK